MTKNEAAIIAKLTGMTIEQVKAATKTTKTVDIAEGEQVKVNGEVAVCVKVSGDGSQFVFETEAGKLKLYSVSTLLQSHFYEKI